MNELERLPDIGKMPVSELSNAGIEEAAGSDGLGSVRAALRLVESGSWVCSTKLYALEGAIRRV